MARPLRMEVPGGRFHITARGNERKIIFREDRDRVHLSQQVKALRQIVQAVEWRKGERWLEDDVHVRFQITPHETLERHLGGQNEKPA